MTRLPRLSLCVVPPQQVARHVSSVVPQGALSALARRQAMNEKQRARWSPVLQPAPRRSQAQRLPPPRVAKVWPPTPWFTSSQPAPAPARARGRVLGPVHRHRALPMDRLGMGALSSRRWRTHSLLLALGVRTSRRANSDWCRCSRRCSAWVPMQSLDSVVIAPRDYVASVSPRRSSWLPCHWCGRREARA